MIVKVVGNTTFVISEIEKLEFDSDNEVVVLSAIDGKSFIYVPRETVHYIHTTEEKEVDV